MKIYEVYAFLIKHKRRSIDDVPEKDRIFVQEILDHLDVPELSEE